jgi:hypothetical protein
MFNRDFAIDRGDYLIRLANENNRLYGAVNAFVSRMYGSRGLGTGASASSAGQSRHGRADQVCLVASRGDQVVGTLTLTVDSGSGLQADSLYPPELEELRMRGCSLCEVTRLALGPEVNNPEVMAALFNVAFILSREVYGRTDLVAEVHPRHAGFYRRTMGYRVAGPERICSRVWAPAVLMHLRLEFARKQILQLAGTPSGGDRNLYRLFWPAAEQDMLLEKLIEPTAAVV